MRNTEALGDLRVLLATEGTYPFAPGGVSVWCDELVRDLAETEFHVMAIAMNPFVASRFAYPPNVAEVQAVALWGIQDPSENIPGLLFSEFLLSRQRTTDEAVNGIFLPLLGEFLQALWTDDPDLDAIGQVLGAMHRYFQVHDYKVTWRHGAVWDRFTREVRAAVSDGALPEPSVHELVQALGWIYHFLVVLDVPLPAVDLVHTSAAAFCGLLGVVSKLERGTPYLLTEHGVYLREQYLSVSRSSMSGFAKRFLLALVRLVVRTNYHFADRVAPVCAFNARWERRLGVPADRIEVVYNGVSPAVFHPAGPGDPRPDPANDRLEIVSIARSDPNKDLETLLRAMAIVHAREPGAHLSIYGSVSVPAYHERMLALRVDLGLEEAVTFQGHVDVVADLYRTADVVVQSSVSEAFPYAILEAMMSGCSVVATEVGGSGEALSDAGILVPSRDPARLAIGILTLLEDPSLRARLGEAARSRALGLFRKDQAMAAYASLYDRLARGARRLAPDEAAVRSLLLARAYALERAGVPVACLDQFWRAVHRAPDAPGTAAILAEIARVEMGLGLRDRARMRLVHAWVLEHSRESA